MFLHANKILFNKIANDLRISNCMTMPIFIFSARQSIAFDYYGVIKNITNYIHDDMPLFHGELSAILGDQYANKLKLNFPTTADVYAQLPFGETHTRIRYAMSRPVSMEHPATIYDNNKVTIAYLQANLLIEENPDKDITLCIYDNEHAILNSLFAFIKKNAALFPRIKFKLYPYEGFNVKEDNVLVVDGAGKYDPYYRENIILMADLCGAFAKDKPLQIDVASQLNIAEFKAKRFIGNGSVCNHMKHHARFFTPQMQNNNVSEKNINNYSSSSR